MKIQEAEKERSREANSFTLLHQDAKTKARCGKLETLHGAVETPCFMPCGTQGTVKALSSEQLEGCGAQMVLANAYHLYLRPGETVFEKIGPLHTFMNWKKAILTDSGGFQLLSLAPLRKVTEEGLFFQSHVDGSRHFLTPEGIVQFQLLLGSDIVMVLDECIGYPQERREAETSLDRTLSWAKRSKTEWNIRSVSSGQLLFGIVQGGIFPDLRKRGCEELLSIDFDGYAIGGLGVGEPKALLWEISSLCTESLPEEKPRYLMGVGTPEDILEGIASGVDFFDCVIPTRNGRNGEAFTTEGAIRLKNSSCVKDPGPIESGCPCAACEGYSRAYLHHLLKSKEILGATLLTLHNVSFYLRLMKESREAIQENRFRDWKDAFSKRLRSRS